MIRRVENMLTYSTLAKKYLMVNKRRSVFTIVGVALVTAFLFIILNGIVNLTLQIREINRADGDYELVFNEVSPETMEQMVNDPRIVSAYIGTEFDVISETEYPNALHVNVSHPYFMSFVLKDLEKEYGVDGEMNELISWTYLQTSDAGIFIAIMLIVLFTYIFSIIGVGVIKNSIELSNLEQIRDYGNLRCIGATRKEIEKIIFNEGLLLEGAGILLGVVIGYPLYIITALNVSLSEIFNDSTTKLSLGFHILPVIVIFLIFMFDLYFTMKSSAKHIAKISPVSAINGEFRIKKGKYKRRHSGLFGLIFGVEGDYAYKNVMRNKGRFIKTVLAMSLGLAAMTFFGCFVGMLVKLTNDSEKFFGYYKYGFVAENNPTYSNEDIKAALPSADSLKRMSGSGEVISTSYAYRACVYSGEDIFMKNHMNVNVDAFLYGEYMSKAINQLENSDPVPKFDSLLEVHDNYTEYRKTGINDVETNILYLNGYEGEDYERLKDNLLEGTLNLSPDGIILVGSGYTFLDKDTGLEYDHIDFSNIKVGDKIEIVDPVELRKRCLERLERSMRDYEDGVAKLTSDEIKAFDDDKDLMEEKGRGFFDPNTSPNAFQDRDMIISVTRHELMEEGKTRTFTVEGILDGNPNTDDGMELILPLDRYLDFMGYTKEDWNGISYGLQKHIFVDDEINDELLQLVNASYSDDGYADNSLPYLDMRGIMFFEINQIVKPMAKMFLLMAFIIFMVVALNCINIANTSAASLHMRRKEFAQLKAMGMTDKGLTKAVILEGVIALFFSAVIGIAIGMGLMIYLYKTLFVQIMLINGLISFPWAAVILGLVISTVVLVGSLYIPLRNMKKSLQAELTLSGE